READLEAVEAHVMARRELVRRAIDPVDAKSLHFEERQRLVGRRQVEVESALANWRNPGRHQDVERIKGQLYAAGNALSSPLGTARKQEARHLVCVPPDPPR